MRRSDLDGPRLTYGGPSATPVRERRRVGIGPSVVAVLVLAVLAGLAGLSLSRGVATLSGLDAARPVSEPVRSARALPAASPPSGSGSDAGARAAVPAGAREAATRFVAAWLDRNPGTRRAALRSVAVPGLAEQLAGTDPAKIPVAQPAGAPEPLAGSDYAATLRQRLTDQTSITVELAADPQARHGWLVYAVLPGGQ